LHELRMEIRAIERGIAKMAMPPECPVRSGEPTSS
jgi:hypothetical protein